MTKTIVHIALLFLISHLSKPVQASVYQINADCLFSMVTQKKGFASSLAHNHFVTLPLTGMKIEADSSHPDRSHFSGEFKIEDLIFDDFSQVKKWQTSLSSLGSFEAIFTEISDKDREEIRTHGLAEDQLNAKKHPGGAFKLKNIAPGSIIGFEKFKYVVTADLTISGKTSEIQIAANIDFSEKILKFEGISKAKFSQFGIEPYTAFLGAVGNEDQFFIYTNCSATPAFEEKSLKP